MSRPVLEESPDLGAPKTVKPNVVKVGFGDGYEQRTSVGMNRNPRVWTVTFTGPFTRIDSIEKFLEERGGVQSFEWADPRGATAYYVCEDWKSAQKKFGVYELSATFRQVFEF